MPRVLLEPEQWRTVRAMPQAPRPWNVFDERTPLLTYAYSFGPALANALAVRGADGFVVVSPPCSVPPQVLDDLAARGPVRALVASNAFHYLGIPEWKMRFPEAEIFAPAQSIARVRRKTDLPGIRPLAEAGAIAGPALELVDMPHYKTGEVLVRATTGRGRVWYVTDIVFNMPELPSNIVAKAIFGLSRSAPGLRVNNIGPLFMVRDKRALKQWLAAELERDAPQWLIPAHGDIAKIDSPAATARRLFR